MFEKLASMKEQYLELSEAISHHEVIQDFAKYQSILKQMSDLRPIVESYDAFLKLENQIHDAKELINDPDFLQAKNNVLESDAIYRNNVTMYNADVLGYNYWIRFFPCAFVFKLFRVKKKEIIS